MRRSTISISQKPNETIIKIAEEAEETKIIEDLQKKITELRKNVQRRKNSY